MNRLSARALAYASVALILGSLSLAGVALVGYGVQAELARAMSAGAAAILTGGVFLAFPAILFSVGAIRGRGRLAPKVADLSSSLGALARDAFNTPNGLNLNSTLNSTLNVLARTAFIGIAARRPIATLGLAALAGAAISTMAESDRK